MKRIVIGLFILSSIPIIVVTSNRPIINDINNTDFKNDIIYEVKDAQTMETSNIEIPTEQNIIITDNIIEAQPIVKDVAPIVELPTDYDGLYNYYFKDLDYTTMNSIFITCNRLKYPDKFTTENIQSTFKFIYDTYSNNSVPVASNIIYKTWNNL